MTVIAPFGTWASPISAARLADAGSDLADLRADGGDLFWIETRPKERGRQVLMMARGGDPAMVRQLTPEGFNVRTRVHEYGGAPFLASDGKVWFANFGDQRLYLQRDGLAPVPLTPEGYRFADTAPGREGALLAVREDHTDPAQVRNGIVALSGAPGEAGTILFDEADFVAYPRLSRNGAGLAWMAWDHPNMPWDDTALFVAEFDGARLAGVRQIAGGPGESAMEPQWAPDRTLYFLSDRSGFWNLYAWRDGDVVPVLVKRAEFGGPLWTLGQANFALLEGGHILARWAGAQGHELGLIGADGAIERGFDLPFTSISSLARLNEKCVAMLVASAEETAAVATLEIETGAVTIVRRPSPAELDPGGVSSPRPVEFPTAAGLLAHAWYYPPASADFDAPAGEAPPLVLQAHGGPTAQAGAALRLAVQFWTSRGFAFADVNYGGSSGYGRAYRKRLEGRWGVVDVEDVIAAARYFAGEGLADPRRIAIRGGSAGGFTVLAALAQSDVFGAGASYFGVADLGALARDTHKFESRYLDGLVGPWPAAKATYDERSPINHLEGFASPLIIFQGSEDPIVPPNQAHMIRDALRVRGAAVAYMEFEGESHGFRRAETIIACAQAELAFYGRVFGFTPAGDLPPIAIENLENRA
ncbi:MAG TPA: prolyl oligopeptidase family serine peptidase [Caulobacteraceae bacterium]|nr:prolyl oligopeptidase family serine peptidase [Caulobacteraceae bacterium]